MCGYVHQSKIRVVTDAFPAGLCLGQVSHNFSLFAPVGVEILERSWPSPCSGGRWVVISILCLDSSGSWSWLLQGQGCRKCWLSLFLSISDTDFWLHSLTLHLWITTSVCCKRSSFLLFQPWSVSAESSCGCDLAHPWEAQGEFSCEFTVSQLHHPLQKSFSRLFPPLEERLACPLLLHWEVSAWWRFSKT